MEPAKPWLCLRGRSDAGNIEPRIPRRKPPCEVVGRPSAARPTIAKAGESGLFAVLEVALARARFPPDLPRTWQVGFDYVIHSTA